MQTQKTALAVPFGQQVASENDNSGIPGAATSIRSVLPASSTALKKNNIKIQYSAVLDNHLSRPMPATEPQVFFQEKRSFAEVKQEILGSYFNTWCNIRLHKAKLEAGEAMLYMDLHAGNGRDEEDSTAMPPHTDSHLYKSIIKDPQLNEGIKTYIYDKSKARLEIAGNALKEMPFYEELIHSPVPLSNAENKAQMRALLEAGAPSLVFLDPFSSAGYGQELLLQAIDAWNSDLFMLLCPENITKAVAGRKISQPLSKLFGERLQKIRRYCSREKNKQKQQEFILAHYTSLLQEKGHFTLQFKVNLPETDQADFYLLFSSPDSQAYRSFKETVLPYTVFQEDGIPLFVANKYLQAQFPLFEQRPVFSIPNLVERLTQQASLYKYKSIEKIYELDSCGTNYTRENYVAAFEQLRKEGKIELLNAKTMQTIRQPTPASVVKYIL